MRHRRKRVGSQIIDLCKDNHDRICVRIILMLPLEELIEISLDNKQTRKEEEST